MAQVVTITPMPGFRWQVEVHFCQSYPAALRLYATWFPDDKEGFKAVTDTRNEGDVLARVIFYRKQFKWEYVAHEAAHVGLHFVRRAGLDVGEEEAEELFAACVEKTFKGILDGAPKSWKH